MNIETLKNCGVDLDSALELLGDIQTYNMTLEEFLKTIDNKVQDIRKYKETFDMNNYSIITHSLKSDAKYLGFTRLAELAELHELASKANDTQKVFDNYALLMDEISRIKRITNSYLGKPVEIPKPVVNNVKGTILVVDDSNIIRTFIQKLFNDTYNVMVASDGKEAIDIINSNNDILMMLLDLNMPNVNGFEVLNYFDSHNLFVKIPVSIITGEDSKENVDRAFTYPVADVLSKPFNERDIKRVVEKTLEFK